MKYLLLLPVLLLALLQGCATSRPEMHIQAPLPIPAPASVIVFEATPDPVAEQKLKETNDLYDKGDYARVVTILSANKDVWNGTVAQRLQAHKLLAFSYCLTRRQAFCEQQFGAALRLDPLFDLKLSERNHPQWGPAFEQAKGSVLVQVERPAQNANRPTWSLSPPPLSDSVNSGINLSITPSIGVDLPKTIPPIKLN